MSAPSPNPRKPGQLDGHLTRQQAAGRRIALLVAAVVIAALLGPFFAAHLAG